MKTKESIILTDIVVQGREVHYLFTVTPGLQPYFTTNEMFVSYDRNVSDIPKSILAIPFVGSVIALTWLTDSILWVNEIDDTFYKSLRNLKISYQELYPYYQFGGRFVAAYRINNEIKETPSSLNNAILLFSGGIDAHTSYIRNKFKKPLLCNIQGWLEKPSSTTKAQSQDFKDVENFCKGENLSPVLIKSNFAKLIDIRYFDKHLRKKLHDSWWHGFQHSMSFISIAIPIAYLYGIKEIIIASSHSIGSKGICASYPTTDTEFRFADTGYTTHDAFELTRQEKVRVIVDYQKSLDKPYPIRVCSFNDHNCGVCPKCFRTILEIISECGDVSNFGFNVPDDMVSYYDSYIKTHYIEFGIEREALLFWPDIKKRILDNYEFIKYKDFVDWFLNNDFVKQRKKAVIRYRIKNLFPLIFRKVKEHLSDEA
jgi:hypothetical protein